MQASFNPFNPFKFAADFIITLLLWIYFTCGYLLFFFPLYLATFIFFKNREKSFQRLNHLFYKCFFFLLLALIPRLELLVHDEVLSIRSSVIVCNHLSYLDPILLISLFKKQKTIVKNFFFKVPLFGWVLKTSGYIPETSGNKKYASLLLKNMEQMKNFLSSGGNLFIFPEGTRSCGNKIGDFNKGAFRIAKFCNAPIKVLLIKNTDRLFQPDNFLFNACTKKSIEVELIGSLNAGYKKKSIPVSNIMAQVSALFDKRSCSKSK